MSSLLHLFGVISCSIAAFAWLVAVSPAAGQPALFPGFDGPTFFDVSGFTSGIATGDVDGDGHLDIAVAGSTDNQISLLFGRGDGTFKPNSPVPLGHRSSDVILLDLDGDGDQDMAVASAVSGLVAILHNDGAGSFTLVQTIGTGVQTQDIAAGDLNGNGLVDLVATNVGSNTASVLFNQGGGLFSPATNYTVGNWPTDVAVGDLNGDEVVDIAVGNAFSDDTTILYNDGKGRFPTSTTFPGNGISEVAIFDADLDGRNDLFVSGVNAIVIFQNLGDGELATYGTLPGNSFAGGGWGGLAFDDFNLDGVPDLAATVFGSPSRVVAMTGVRGMLFHIQEDSFVDGDVNVHDLNRLLLWWGHPGASTDFNHDTTVNAADLAQVLALWGEAPLFQFWQSTIEHTPWTIVTGDFDEDGAPDLAVPISGANVAVFLNRMRAP